MPLQVNEDRSKDALDGGALCTITRARYHVRARTDMPFSMCQHLQARIFVRMLCGFHAHILVGSSIVFLVFLGFPYLHRL